MASTLDKARELIALAEDFEDKRVTWTAYSGGGEYVGYACAVAPALARAVVEMAEALDSAILNLGCNHSGHWDKTGGSGSGCLVCMAEHETKDRIRVALARVTEEG